MSLRLLTAGLFLLATPLPAGAQSQAKDPCGADSQIPFARIGLRRLCQLAQQPEVRAATGTVDGLDLMSKVPPDILWRMADQDLVAFVSLFSDSLGQLPAATCSEFAPHPRSPTWGSRFLELAAGADSVLSVRWATLLESWVWVVVHKEPLRPQATSAEAIAFLRTVAADLSPADRLLLQRLNRNEGVAPQSACALARKLYRILGEQPKRPAARAIRALMTGAVSFFSAV
jgi:hypothetical protein